MRRNYQFFLLPLLVVVMALLPLQVSAVDLRGDINGDGKVNIGDVTALINLLLSGDGEVGNGVVDVNADGALNISDVTALINHLLSGAALEPIEAQVEEFTVCDVAFYMIPVEGGTFSMGATSEQGSDASSREKPVHQVTVSSYYIGETEVTQALWLAVMGTLPSNFTGMQLPVEQVSWEDCQAFIAALNAMTGQQFRLPTEAEWEFAARGGNMSMGYKYSGSDNLASVGWYSYNDSWDVRGTGYYGTHPVATRNPNELMLYDMSGNVHEWCQDWYGAYDAGEQVNPVGPAGGTTRVYRGGSWYFDEWFCRVSFRNSVSPSYTSYGIGLRLAM